MADTDAERNKRLRAFRIANLRFPPMLGVLSVQLTDRQFLPVTAQFVFYTHPESLDRLQIIRDTRRTQLPIPVSYACRNGRYISLIMQIKKIKITVF